MLFDHLVFIPYAQRAVGVERLILPEHVRMPRNQFFAQLRGNVRKIKRARLFFQRGMKRNLH